MADKVEVGDKFICYLVRVSRWIGVLDVLSGPFIDRSPIFVRDADPFIVRFKVNCSVWLPLEQTVPVHEPEVFSRLSFTRGVKPGGYWLGCLRRSLLKINAEDGHFLESLLGKVASASRTFPVDKEDYERALKRRIQRQDGSVVVSVPDDKMPPDEVADQVSTERESIRMQAALCRIGEAMGFKSGCRWLTGHELPSIGQRSPACCWTGYLSITTRPRWTRLSESTSFGLKDVQSDALSKWNTPLPYIRVYYGWQISAHCCPTST
jgi:hypothetical protein